MIIYLLIYKSIMIYYIVNTVTETEIKNEKSTMVPGEKFDDFKKILEGKFLETREEQIEEIKDAFISELDKLDLSNSEILENLIYYFNQIYWTAQLKTTDRPLHISRDFALDLFAKVFSDMVHATRNRTKKD